MRAANGINLAFLNSAQQLYLCVQRQFADLVKEQRAAMRFFKLADALGDGASECPFFVAEENALDQVFGQCTAVNGDKWATCAG